MHTLSTISSIAQQLHSSHQSIVLSTGFFDLLHQEHINFLQKAKAAGDILIVGVESDVRARTVKGRGRPVQTQRVRAAKVAKYADYVILLSDDFDHQEAYESLMSAVHPAIYAVSSHTSHLDNKRELTEKFGGQLVIVHKFNKNISTSQIINNSQ